MKRFFDHPLIIFFLGGLQVFSLLLPLPALAGPALDCEGSAKAYALQGIPCTCVNGQIVCDKPAGGHKAKKHGITSGDVNAMVVGTIFQGLLTSMFAPPTSSNNAQEALAAQQKAAALAAQQAAAHQRAQEAAFQAEHNKMMQSFKQLDGSQGVAFKSLSDASLAFKTLDDDAETLAANARKPFDTAAEPKQPTPFFGDTMPLKDIQLLVNPENDPRIVDLRNATAYVAKNLKDSANPAPGTTKPRDGKADGKPITKGPDCTKLNQKLQGFLTQRDKFHNTINLAQEQLTTWEDANRNALLNAAKDGIEYFTGQLLEGLANRGKAAERLQRIYEKNGAQMAQDGVDVAAIQAKIARLKMLSSAGKISELTSNILDWQTFIKDGMSGLMAQLTSSNQEVHALLDDPKLQKYFETESPELKAMLDISKIAASNKVFGKWVAKKVPVIAGVELAINQSYNGLDWFLSFKRMTEANKINGKVLHAAKNLQQHIDDTSWALRDCP
ncbi:MAG: hypothetical protein ACYDHV_13605 [Desulfurivibrionaceae bacterium]|jgi:hypothetical protein